MKIEYAKELFEKAMKDLGFTHPVICEDRAQPLVLVAYLDVSLAVDLREIAAMRNPETQLAAMLRPRFQAAVEDLCAFKKP